MQFNKPLYIGTSNIVVPVPKKDFPPEYANKSRLSYYPSFMNSLEVNSTFYKNPKAATIERWATEVGEDFIFTFKLPQSITHVPNLHFTPDDVKEFVLLVNHIGNKKGCLLIQLPPSVTIYCLPALNLLLSLIRETDHDYSWHVAVEFRHTSWYAPKTEKLLQDFGAATVIHDHPKAPVPLELMAPFFFLRFHGEGGRYSGSYETPVLKQYASVAKQWAVQGNTGYCYFNNTIGDALANAITFQELTE